MTHCHQPYDLITGVIDSHVHHILSDLQVTATVDHLVRVEGKAQIHCHTYLFVLNPKSAILCVCSLNKSRSPSQQTMNK